MRELIKKTLVTISVLCLFTQCKSQFHTISDVHSYFKSIETTTTDKLDVNSEQFKSFIQKDSEIVRKGKVEHYFSSEDTLANGDVVSMTGSTYDGYYVKIERKKGWFDIYNHYYVDGNIKGREIVTKIGNSKYGFEYKYDEAGKLVEVIDYEKAYQTNFLEIISIAEEYAKKYNYAVKVGVEDIINSAYYTMYQGKDYVSIDRKEIEGKRYWYIGFTRLVLEGNHREVKSSFEWLELLIDDSKGEIIAKKNYYTLPNMYVYCLEKMYREVVNKEYR